MSRYIDIDKAIPIAIQAVVDVVGHGITQVDAVNIAEKIEEASTADVVEVRHGKWEYIEEDDCYICSNCKASALNNYRSLSVNSNYCPNCGAKMGGERKDK